MPDERVIHLPHCFDAVCADIKRFRSGLLSCQQGGAGEVRYVDELAPVLTPPQDWDHGMAAHPIEEDGEGPQPGLVRELLRDG